MIKVMSRSIDDDEKRTELEIEVILKWVMHTYHLDPTGVQHTLYSCSSRNTIVNAIQHARMERYHHPEYIVLQNQAAASEEGLYTVVRGRVDILMFSPDSPNLIRLETAKKNKMDDEIRQILKFATRVAQLNPYCGFGELSAITNVRRGASVCASKIAKEDDTTDVFVITKNCLNELIAKQYKNKVSDDSEGDAPTVSAEIMDYLRQSGLAHKTPIPDMLKAAACFKKIQCDSGTILYRKGDPVDKVFIVLGGEFLLDIGNFNESKNHTGLPFQSLDQSKCFILRRGSILGDEGMVGKNKTYQASAVALAEENVLFEIGGDGLSFLAKRFGLEKYSALAIKEQSPANGGFKNALKSEVMVHAAFTCLRKCIASQYPSRGLNKSKNFVKTAPDKSTAMPHVLLSPIKNPIPLLPSTEDNDCNFSGKISTKCSTLRRQDKTPINFKKTKKTNCGHSYMCLPAAAMHHAKSIVKQVQLRELNVMRNEAMLNVKEAAEEMKHKKTGTRKEMTATEKRMRELVEEKYQRAVRIYKSQVTGDKIAQNLHESRDGISADDSADVVKEDFSNAISMSDLATTTGLNSIITFDDIQDEDEINSADEENLVSQGMDRNVSRVEHYLFYIKWKAGKTLSTQKKVIGSGGISTPEIMERVNKARKNKAGNIDEYSSKVPLQNAYLSTDEKSDSSSKSKIPFQQHHHPTKNNMDNDQPKKNEKCHSSQTVLPFQSISADISSTGSEDREKSIPQPKSVSQSNAGSAAEDRSSVSLQSSSLVKPQKRGRLSSAGDERPSELQKMTKNRSKRSSLDFAMKREKLSSPPMQSRIASAGNEPKLTAAALKSLGSDAVAKTRNISSENVQKKESDGFMRATTVNTIGVDTILITDKEGKTRRIVAKNHMKHFLVAGGMPPSGGQIGAVHFIDSDSSIASDPSFRRNHPKPANEVSPIVSIEKLFGINSSISDMSHMDNLRNFVPEHLWTTRYMKSSTMSVPDKKLPPLAGVSDDDFDSYKSDSSISYSRSMILRAEQNLHDNIVPPMREHTMAEKTAALSRARGLSDGTRKNRSARTSLDNILMKWDSKNEKKVDVLQTFESLLKTEHLMTGYIDGRKKNISQSEYRFNRDVDKIKDADEISSLNRVSEPTKDLLMWKRFCSDRVISVNKNNELKEIPIRAKSGFHTIYWGKLLVDKSCDD